MSVENSDPKEEPPAPTPRLQVTLDPIAKLGAAALPPDPALKIRKVRVSKLVLAFKDHRHPTITCEGDDILSREPCDTLSALTLQPGAELQAATLDFDIADATEPVAAELRPPNQAKLKGRAFARRIANWLVQNNYAMSVPALLSQFLLSVLFAVLTFAAASLGDDPDDDSGHEHRPRLSAKI